MAIIPARGGSKGIPRKNVAEVGGRPLLAHTVEQARASTSVDRVVLSTDDEEIAELGRRLGAEVLFRRPASLAADGTPMLDVLRHASDHLTAEQESPEAIVLLQPTSPLRRADDVDGAVALLRSTGAASVVSVCEVPHNFVPESLMVLVDGVLQPYEPASTPAARRQDKARLYARNGPAVLVVRPEVLNAGHLYGDPTVPFVMPPERSWDVDEPFDLHMVELLLGREP